MDGGNGLIWRCCNLVLMFSWCYWRFTWIKVVVPWLLFVYVEVGGYRRRRWAGTGGGGGRVPVEEVGGYRQRRWVGTAEEVGGYRWRRWAGTDGGGRVPVEEGGRDGTGGGGREGTGGGAALALLLACVMFTQLILSYDFFSLLI